MEHEFPTEILWKGYMSFLLHSSFDLTIIRVFLPVAHLAF